VLLEETLAAMQIKADGYYLDATFGRGGHAGAMLDKLGEAGRLCVVDRDPQAIATAHQRFGSDARVLIVQSRFGCIRQQVPAAWAQRGFDGCLFDLGVSSPQLDDATRGFSFLRDGPLDMRMDPDSGMSAAQWLAQTPEAEIARVLYEYGEERFSRRIARAIVERRQRAPLTRTTELAELVASVQPFREANKHPATRTFQAIRIEVNQELAELQQGLEAALELLGEGGRLCAISFHSLEDRAVKQFMRRHSSVDPVYAWLPFIPASAQPRMKLVGKAQRAGDTEVKHNPRARSATLRVAEKLARHAA
jgi:16S rRNA (cytosine1402-N4)-methyltransferase